MALCAALLLTGAGFAQTAPSGVLGRRFVDLNFDVVDFSGLHDNGYSQAMAVNLPTTKNVDFSFGYAYGWLRNHDTTLHDETLSTSVLWHDDTPEAKLFGGAGIGYDWAQSKFIGHKMDDNAGIWGVVVGVEIPVGAITLTPSISYNDAFQQRRIGAMHYGTEANYWFTPAIAGYANATYTDYSGRNGTSWMYRTGLRLKF